MADLVLSYRQRTAPDGSAHVLLASHPHLSEALGSRGVEFVHVDSGSLPEPTVLDGYLFFYLLFGMQHADRIRVEGPVSAQALRNARAFQEYWHCWLPDRYRIVDITAETITSSSRTGLRRFGRQRPDRAVSAFSGGTDATFTLLRHAGGALGPAAYPMRDVLMVHGFDVAADDADGFSRLRSRVQPLLDDVGVTAHVVRTNARDVRPYLDWEHGHGAQLACILHQFSPDFSHGLIGSTDPFHRQVLAWGSNPMTDPLLSGAAFTVVHDGAGFDRTQKLTWLAEHPLARRTLKVCWEGGDAARNCGSCDKCVRTRLVFALRGDTDPPCFDTPFDPDSIEVLTTTRESLLHSVGLLEAARTSTVDAPWVGRLEHLLAERTAGYNPPRPRP